MTGRDRRFVFFLMLTVLSFIGLLVTRDDPSIAVCFAVATFGFGGHLALMAFGLVDKP